MKIIVNGEAMEIDPNLTLQQLLEQLNFKQQRLAVELNLEIIPRSQYTNYTLKEGDRVEIVHAIGGG